MEFLPIIFLLVFTLLPIAVFYVIGTSIESSHLRSLQERESKLYKNLVVTNLKQLPQDVIPMDAFLCSGSVVIGTDYFKRFAATLKTLIGGRMRSLETVLERGRREAILRMVEEAKGKGADLIINVRVETSTIGSSMGDRQTFASAEIVAYGTAVRRKG